MTSSLTLDVLIATHKPEGIDRVAAMNLPSVAGVRYIVSWQDHRDKPVPTQLSLRNDVKIHRFDMKRGVSANRNNAFLHSTADIMLVADDDVIYTPDGLKAVIRSFEENPDVDYASFMYDGPNPKTYPNHECDLSVTPRFFTQSAIEIAVRRQSPAGELRFNELFGPGATPFTAAEDAVFFLSAQRRGIRMRFFPIVIARHPDVSTGFRPINDVGNLLAEGAVIALMYPRSALLRIPLKAWRLMRRRRSTFFKALYHITRGAIMSLQKVRL